MRTRRYGTFTGGIDLPDEKRQTLGSRIKPLPQLDRLDIPLDLCGGPGAEPAVADGARVRAGDLLAECPQSAVKLFAPTGGTVQLGRRADAPGDGKFVTSRAIGLVDLDAPPSLQAAEPVDDWEDLETGDLLERIDEGGLMTCESWPGSLHRRIRTARGKGIRILICGGMESQPRVTAAHRLLTEFGEDVAGGLAILGRAVGADETAIAVDRRRTQSYRRMIPITGRLGIERVALVHKYPAGAAAMLVKVLTRREVPLGGSPEDVHAMVVSPATCMALYRWVAHAQPLTGRVVTVAGPGVAEPGNYYVPFGTRCMDLVGPVEPPIIHGGPMVGFRVTDRAVVGPSTNAVLSLADRPADLPTTCIRCSWCTNHCPARLNVAALNDVFEMGLPDRAERLGVEACVECGVCSYVCPARLPLSQRTRELKRIVRHQRRKKRMERVTGE